MGEVHRHPAAHQEEQRLDAALSAVDAYALDSLRRDQAARRRRRALVALLVVAAAAVGAGAVAWILRPPRSVDATMAEGWRLWRERRFIDAEAQFRSATERAPEAAAAWNGLGWARLNQGNAAGGRDAFLRCLSLHPDHAACLNGLGNLAFGRCDYAEAEARWKAAAAAAPAARYGLTILYLVQGRYEDARLSAEGLDHPLATELAAAARSGRLEASLRQRIQPRPCPAAGGTLP